MKILIVEDEPNVHHMIGAILRNDYFGVEIDVAETGNSALARYNTFGPYDLVITDFAHPGGLYADELVAAIRASNPQQAVLLQTGNAGDQFEAFIQRWKDIPYLPKPWKVAEFRALVKQLVA